MECHKLLNYLIDSSKENVRVDKFWTLILIVLGNPVEDIFFNEK